MIYNNADTGRRYITDHIYLFITDIVRLYRIYICCIRIWSKWGGQCWW